TPSFFKSNYSQVSIYLIIVIILFVINSIIVLIDWLHILHLRLIGFSYFVPAHIPGSTGGSRKYDQAIGVMSPGSCPFIITAFKIRSCFAFDNFSKSCLFITPV